MLQAEVLVAEGSQDGSEPGAALLGLEYGDEEEDERSQQQQGEAASSLPE